MEPLRSGFKTSEGIVSIAAILAPIIYNLILVPLFRKIGVDAIDQDHTTEAIKQAIMWGSNAVISSSYSRGRSTVKAAALAPEYPPPAEPVIPASR